MYIVNSTFVVVVGQFVRIAKLYFDNGSKQRPGVVVVVCEDK